MVIKLIKNGFIDSWQSFRNVIVAILVAFTLLTLMSFTGESTASVFFVSAAMLAMFALIVAAFVMSIMAFIRLLYKSLYREESYRAFTQPVASWEIFVSKIVVAILWTILISVVASVASLISMSIMFRDLSEVFAVVKDLFSYVLSYIDWSLFLVWGVESLVSTIFTCSLFLMVGAIVNSSRFQNRRVMWFVIIYLLIVFAFGQLIGNFDTSTIVAQLDPGFYQNIENTAISGVVNWADLFTIAVNQAGVQTLLLLTFLKALLAGFMGFATVWLWDHKLEVID
ncbi:hypothetical protein AOC36_00760 [Erysipelothrix larvae]|uniref:Uncharacterized protein n=1 Tax=Erysipelothrix larvae TaxID=1514105 RepID=A0A0X8GY49_9FIRM|nr:hypothetical protein [Erysipelothrix larvae]AMC92574.1 hypothetical protein AOC36_00760 [Erysipelothrix larvae]